MTKFIVEASLVSPAHAIRTYKYIQSHTSENLSLSIIQRRRELFEAEPKEPK